MVNTSDLKSDDESLTGSSPVPGTLIAWAAGLFEGEGSIFLVGQLTNGERYTYPRLELKMTDQDVVEKFREVVGCGNIHLKPSRKLNYKTAWCWQLTNKMACQIVIEMFWPYLGTRRKAKAQEVGLA